MATHRVLTTRRAVYAYGVLYMLGLSTITATGTATDTTQRWSRQISNTNFLNDWVPVQPRQPNGRVLNFGPPPFQPPQAQQQSQFPSSIFSHPNAPQAPSGVSYATDPFPQRLMFQAQPLQFVQPQLPQNNVGAGQPLLVNGVYQPMIVHNSQPQILPHHHQHQNQHQHQHQHQNQHQLQHQHQSPQNIPQAQILQHPPAIEQQQNFQYQHFGPAIPQPSPQAPAQASFLGDVAGPVPVKPHTEQLIQNVPAIPQINSNVVDPVGSLKRKPANSQKEQEEVQLLYVPLDTLYKQQRDKVQNTKYNVLPHPVNPLQINNLYTGNTPTAAPLSSPSTYKTTRASKHVPTPTPHSGHRFSSPAFNEFTTPSSRLKPHQPPLAMFMYNDGNSHSRTSVSDVLNTLANADTIDVLDSASRKAPKVFVGPSGLKTPDGYTKFDLPYLSNIEQTRLERQIDKLPFFVAPLSYRAPKGFAKIPLPAPHVGSVVVNSIPGDQKPQYQSNKPILTESSQTQYYTTTPEENVHYVTIPSPSPIPNSQIRSTTSGYTPPKYNLGFSFGIDDLTTTPRTKFFASSTPSYVSQHPEFGHFKNPSTTPATRNSHLHRATRPTASPTGSVPLFHSTNEEQVNAQSDNSFSSQQNTEFFSNFAPSPSSQVSEDYFNQNKNNNAFQLNNFPQSNGTSFTTQVFGNVNDPSQSTGIGSFINHYHHPSSSTRDYYNSPVTTTRAPAPVKYTFPSIFDDIATTPKPRFSTLNPEQSTVLPLSNEYSTKPEDAIKTKNYYKDQGAFRARPQGSTPPPPQVYEADSYESLPYNPVSSTPSFLQDTVLYNRDRSTPTTTENYIQTNPPTTPRTTFTYYTASSADDEDEPIQPVVNKFVNSMIRGKDNALPGTRTKTEYIKPGNGQDDVTNSDPLKYKTFDPFYRQTLNTQQDEYSSPVTTTPYYESTRDDLRSDKHYTQYHHRQQEPEVYTSPKSYQLPSELPPISPNLPGLINGLMDKSNKNGATSTLASTTTPVPTTRRAVTRGRGRPQLNRTTSTEDVTGLEVTTRRNPPRGRRPVPTYANRTTTPRTPVTRNSSRVRYNPTPEERAKFRTRQRTSTRVKEEENIDYQRDVLKQNYPVINRDTTIITTTSTTEKQTTYPDTSASYGHESEHTVQAGSTDISNNLPEHFSSLQDHMQIPQEYQGLSKEIDIHELKSFPPVYFSRDPQPQEQSEVQIPEQQEERTERTVIITPTTQSSLQTEADQEEITEVLRTRRPSFIRRTQTSTTLTTTPAPATTQEYDTTKSKDRYNTRTKSRYEPNSSQVRIKTRIRGRRPTTEATTTVSSSNDDEVNNDKTYRKVNRFNKDFYKDYAYNKRPVKEPSVRVTTVAPAQEQRKAQVNRHSSRFSLDTEESQWSSNLSQNSFHPVDPEELSKSTDRAPEPEIVTAAYNDDSSTQGTYLFNVAAKYGDNNEASTTNIESHPNVPSSSVTTTSESSIADLIKAAISDFSNDIPVSLSDKDSDELDEVKVTTIASALETTSAKAKTDTAEKDKKSKRRGVWKRVRVRPIDGFETAESQNIGKQIFNTILSDSTKELNAKHILDKGSNVYQSYDLSDETKSYVDESIEDVTRAPFPGDIDLGTGAPQETGTKISADETPTTEKVEVMSTQESEISTIVPSVEEEGITITPTGEVKIVSTNNTTSTSTTTTTSTVASPIADSDKESLTESPDSADTPMWTESPDASIENGPVQNYADMKSEWNGDDDTSINEQRTENSRIQSQDSETNLYMDEVRQKLSSLFSFPDEPVPQKEFAINTNFKRTRGPSYTTIERNRVAAAAGNEVETINQDDIQPSPMKLHPVSVEKTILHPVTESSFHRDLMDSVVYATSTSTEISHETEICYRGRCVKSIRKP